VTDRPAIEIDIKVVSNMIKNKQPNQMEYTELITDAQEHQKGKVCTKCKEHQLLSEFYKCWHYKDGLHSWCKSCTKEYKDNQCRFKAWFGTKRKDGKRNGWKWDIEPEDIPGVKIKEIINEVTRPSSRNKNIMYKKRYTSWEATEYPKVCPVLGMKLDWGMNGHQPNSPSLDRIDSTKGYIPGNVMMMSNLANKMKQNATPEQLKQFSRYHLFEKVSI
jgi:hypothetical protein